MPRYIDAEQKITVTYYDEEHEEWFQKSETIDDYLLNADEEIPTADVVEVVRCKECIWYDEKRSCGSGDHALYECRNLERFFPPDFFCKDGERRDDEESTKRTY